MQQMGTLGGTVPITVHDGHYVLNLLRFLLSHVTFVTTCELAGKQDTSTTITTN